jgi:rubrerythrin
MADVIYRQEAIDKMLYSADIIALRELPSAQPKGHWIGSYCPYTCDQCGHNIGFHMENYCPSCGARMVKEGEEHD